MGLQVIEACVSTAAATGRSATSWTGTVGWWACVPETGDQSEWHQAPATGMAPVVRAPRAPIASNWASSSARWCGLEAKEGHVSLRARAWETLAIRGHQESPSETCWCLCGSRAESTGQLATGDKMSPSQLWVGVSMRARVRICEFAPANGEGLQLPRLIRPGSSNWGDWVSELSCWWDESCTYNLSSGPPPCSARDRRRMRLLPAFVWVLGTCLICGASHSPGWMRICGVYGYSACVCRLGTQFQPHYWLDLGHGNVKQICLPWAVRSRAIYFPLMSSKLGKCS